MTFESLTLTPFCFEKSSVRKCIFNIFNVLATFSVRFRLKSSKICKNKDHTCLFYCINTCQVARTDGLVFKQLPRDSANVNT